MDNRRAEKGCAQNTAGGIRKSIPSPAIQVDSLITYCLLRVPVPRDFYVVLTRTPSTPNSKNILPANQMALLSLIIIIIELIVFIHERMVRISSTKDKVV